MYLTRPATPRTFPLSSRDIETHTCLNLLKSPHTTFSGLNHSRPTPQMINASPPKSQLDSVKDRHPWSRSVASEKISSTLWATPPMIASVRRWGNVHTSCLTQSRPGETTGNQLKHQSPLAIYRSHLDDRASQQAETRAVALPIILMNQDLSSQPSLPHPPHPWHPKRDRLIETSKWKRTATLSNILP